MLKLAINVVGYSFFVKLWVRLLKLFVVLKYLVALHPFCLHFTFFKQFSGLNEDFTLIHDLFTDKFLDPFLFRRERDSGQHKEVEICWLEIVEAIQI